ncbi:MAG: Inner rane protein YrbG, predicted calcium/sodium:proton antiporter [Deltaproteobacteria bacterium]|nr:Inner rane protein YrbG, predicted calcium/sodium:proton antiporter [Deltaproteobacteria bacterium]
MPAVEIGSGLALLFGGGEALVRGAVALAHRLGLSKALIGATVVGFGTSAPELAVAVDAGLTGHGAIALGTVVGSNICNVLLVLPVAALILPVRWSRRAIRRDATALLVALFGVTTFAIVAERRAPSVAVDLLSEEADALDAVPFPLALAVLGTIGGIAAVVGGADLLVEGATELARRFGVSEATIGLTLVAVGTSLPELAAGAAAARRQHPEVALGNVLGSNVFNQLGIVGAAALMAPLAVPPEVARADLWAMLALMVATAAGLLLARRLGRAPALVGLLLYASWVAFKL